MAAPTPPSPPSTGNSVIQSANLPLKPTDLVIMSQNGRSVGAPYGVFQAGGGGTTPTPPSPPPPPASVSIALAETIATWGM